MQKALVIGYGSIGKKHYNYLKNLNVFDIINISSKHLPSSSKNLKSQKDIIKYNPEYIVIANNSSLHFDTLNFLNSNFKNIKIYIEKPLFIKFQKIKLNHNNKVLVGYNLRQHQGINFLKKFIKKKEVKYAEIKCTSYLPKWRKQNYKYTSSANKSLSGDIIFELSHEIDYANLLFQKLNPVYCNLKKISNLEIRSNDFFFGNFKSIKCKNINIHLGYYDKIPERYIKIITKNESLKLDFLTGELLFNSKKHYRRNFLFDINKSYIESHISFINNRYEHLCSFTEGEELVRIINKIYKKLI